MRKWMLAGIAALVVAAMMGHAHAGDTGKASAGILVTQDQRAMEAKARRLLRAPAVQQEIFRSVTYLKGVRAGNSADDRTERDSYVHDLAYGLALIVVDSDPDRPRILWDEFPGAHWGYENPDNVYRYFPVSPDARYQIIGRLGTSDHVSFQLSDGGGQMSGHLDNVVGHLASEDLRVAPDGSFSVALGPDAADGRPNYLQLVAGAKQVMIRDTMSDWSEVPMTLQVRRVGGPPHRAPTDDELTERIASALAASVKLWVQVTEKYNYAVAPNTLPSPIATGHGGLPGQYLTTGNFDLTDDQALVITARKGTARYLGFELGSNWYISFEYAAHSSSLSNGQAAANPDGSYTYVIALRDPGVANWLDPVGHHTGLTLMRWQGLNGPLKPEDAPVVKLVNIADLPQALPPGTPITTPAERHRQMLQRQHQVECRRSAQP
ncbi:MAG TPA: hypothetical protein VKZ79_17990 [Alphaproteobacteria bacterium]|nr:hypothetical protein [Alphaproteobacteria bacterium]